jgi:arylsulfatase A-like enzyme
MRYSVSDCGPSIRREMKSIMGHLSRFLKAGVAILACSLLTASTGGPQPGTDRSPPDILLISVDALRADHLSIHGYGRETSPTIDRLMASGAIFDQARTVEPLTAPALISMITSLPPHIHGATRNGLKMRGGLTSMPKILSMAGYETAAFLGNWTLKDKLTRMGEHFQHYDLVLNRKRWFGLMKGEATAEDLNARAFEYLEKRASVSGPRKPLFLWVHYVEPHAPYRLWRDEADQLGLPKNKLSKLDRYDTEIRFVDRRIGELLDGLASGRYLNDPIIVFTADHGESLGEHNYWGHGRNLYEPGLHIPMSITWNGHFSPVRLDEQAINTDLAPTLLHLAGIPVPKGFTGFNWAGVLVDGDDPPRDRITTYQAHKGAVISNSSSEMARRSGLLEVGMIRERDKELFRVGNNRRWQFDLAKDPGEIRNLSARDDSPTESLVDWMQLVYEGLLAFEDMPPETLDPESIEQLRSLGYID